MSSHGEHRSYDFVDHSMPRLSSPALVKILFHYENIDIITYPCCENGTWQDVCEKSGLLLAEGIHQPYTIFITRITNLSSALQLPLQAFVNSCSLSKFGCSCCVEKLSAILGISPAFKLNTQFTAAMVYTLHKVIKPDLYKPCYNFTRSLYDFSKFQILRWV